uniref:NR LBD domain-containing protein n=1 Tax=Steinernema glaseri TaxID=37863 RepID=A0A1I7Y8F3_9BILA
MMEVRLERLCNLASELSTLHESRRSTFARCSQASSTVDDIIAKMEFLKEVVLQEEDVLNRAASRRMSALRKRSIFTKKSSNASSSGTVITHATINGDAQFDVKQAASRLYDVENYSKCVRLIEKVPPAETDRDLLLLCHGSYKHMLSDAANTREASKLCEWWRAFVEKLESEKACQHFRLEILECLAECLWETSRLPLPLDSSTARERIMDDLMITKIELYQVSAGPIH